MDDLLIRLAAGEVLVADGAMGTLLLERGLAPGECPESFALARPDLLSEIARLYCDAGAQIIETDTFGASPLKLALYGLDDQTAEINRCAVAAVRQAVGDRAHVAGSCGPSGCTLKPYGDTEPDQVYASFLRQMQALIAAGVDAVCIETMTDLTEARLAIEAARAVSATIPILATMTFDRTRRGFYTIMGVDVAAAASGLAAAGADVIGSNCGNGIENMIAIAREFRAQTALPLLIQSNAGLPQLAAGRAVYPETPEFMAEKAVALLDAGVAIIGGCCGTTPEHIRALRRMVDGRPQNL